MALWYTRHISGNKNGPKAEQDYQCAPGYETCPSCGYGLGASCKYGTETKYSRCRHKNEYTKNEENCNADDGYKLEGKKCTIKDDTKYTECNCAHTTIPCDTNDGYQCTDKKCSGNACIACKCVASEVGNGCSCGGGECTAYKCGRTVCVARAACDPCPPPPPVDPGGPSGPSEPPCTPNADFKCPDAPKCEGAGYTLTNEAHYDSDGCRVNCKTKCEFNDPCKEYTYTEATCTGCDRTFIPGSAECGGKGKCDIKTCDSNWWVIGCPSNVCKYGTKDSGYCRSCKASSTNECDGLNFNKSCTKGPKLGELCQNQKSNCADYCSTLCGSGNY